MTAPVYQPEYYPQETPQDQPGLSATEKALVAALAVWLATAAAAKAIELPVDLARRLAALVGDRKAARAAGRLALAVPLTGRGRTGSPTTTGGGGSDWPTPGSPIHPGDSAHRDALTSAPGYRAQFLINSARRMAQAKVEGRELATAARQERAWLDAHRRAQANRIQVAAHMDELAQQSPWLEWHAVLDDRTTPDCRAMHGRIFTLDVPPAIGWPGAVHPRCRCTATPFGVGLFGAASTVTSTTAGAL